MACDFWFIYGLNHPEYLLVRMPFIVLTLVNIVIIVFIMVRYRLFSLFFHGARTERAPEDLLTFKNELHTPGRGDSDDETAD